MRAIQQPFWRYSPSHFLMGIAVAILAYHPVLWLVNTWRDPSYDSQGFIVFAVCLLLFLWSVSSKRLTCQPIERTTPYVLLGLSALIRLLGQVFAINMIGALTLVVDVYAISRLSGLHLRTRYVSPLWLSVCFAFSLPLERLLQRTIGYGLQHLSADGACTVLSNLYEQVSCAGVRIMINAQDVLVDLPCSGARCLLLLLFFYFLCAAVSRFRIRAVLAGMALTLLSAYAANVLRITVLATGIAYPQMLGGIDVMAQPWHDMIGLTTLALGIAPIIFFARYFYRPNKLLNPVLDQVKWGVPYSLKQDAWWLTPKKKQTKTPLLASCVVIILALTIVNLPRHAVDVAERDIALSLPQFINDAHAVEIPLTPMENAYFQQYGGSVQKASYGNHSLMVVKTSAPLRHLHAPDECLRGAGMDVEYKGLVYEPLPTAIYKATDKEENQSYRIAVTFVSEGQSHVTTNVSEAVWHWMQDPKQDWTAVQRISHWEAPEEDTHEFDQAVMTAMDILTPNTPFELATIEEGLTQ